ncbi:MAG: hypothetical protein WDM91_10935 [Rhizomicrobium sp.]
MSNLTFGERHIVRGLDAVADAFSGTVYSDVVKMSGYHAARFILHKAAGALGTSTITVEACDDATGANPVALPFYYQAYAGADDVPSDVAAATAAGFATTAGANQLYVVEVESQRMGDKSWLRLKAVEVVNDPVLGGVLVELLKPRFASQVPLTAIA